MLIPFLLFLITILLLSIFWELTKINGRIKKALALSPGKSVSPAKVE